MTTSGSRAQRGGVHNGLLAGGAAVLVAGVMALILINRTAPEPPPPSLDHAGHDKPGHTHGTENLSVGERYPELARVGEWLSRFVGPETVIYAGELSSVQAAGGAYRPLPDGNYEEVLNTMVEEKGDFLILHQQVAGAETPELAPLTNDKGMAWYDPRLAPVYVLPGPARNSVVFRIIRPGGPDSLRVEKTVISKSRFMEHSTNHMIHGSLATRKGLWKRAAEEFGYALATEPENVIALNNRAWALLKANERLERAEELARSAVELAPDEPDYLDTLIEVLEAVGKKDEAQTYRARLQSLSGGSGQ